ncbi:hypothetical protein B0O99DRAFT_741340 [Bisporella sp. PMI_857]|nr:hypothetical protein B0O99DRAFT_741340 [Bisporella sp. PMI_857]
MPCLYGLPGVLSLTGLPGLPQLPGRANYFITHKPSLADVPETSHLAHLSHISRSKRQSAKGIEVVQRRNGTHIRVQENSSQEHSLPVNLAWAIFCCCCKRRTMVPEKAVGMMVCENCDHAECQSCSYTAMNNNATITMREKKGRQGEGVNTTDDDEWESVEGVNDGESENDLWFWVEKQTNLAQASVSQGGADIRLRKEKHLRRLEVN